MAGDSVIGALRVDLGLNSAQFTAGLKQAQTGLNRFGDAAKVGLGLVAAAATAATVALGFAVKGAIDHADALSKAAQKAGVTVEALSRLSYAAQFSEISLDDMTASLGKLSKTMADATQNVHGASASAFAALGINVTDASGKLRSADAVFSDIADRFSRLQDGATKTALSMALFGKSGAQLIPLLNEGAVGLKRFADESDRLGNTISTETAAAANHFNDTLTKLSASFAGLVNRALPPLLSALTGMADGLSKLDPTVLAVGVGVVGLASAATLATPALGTLTKAVSLLYGQLALIAALPAGVLALAGGIYLGSTTPVGAGEDDLIKKLGLTKIPAAKNSSGSPDDRGTATGVAGSTFDFASVLNPPGVNNAGKAIDTLTDKLSPLKQGLVAVGGAAKLAQQAMSEGFQTAVGSIGNLTGALSHLFKQNKAFAVATAVLQGLQGVAYALGSSAPPWNFINAAAVGIEAAANVANILATNENSTSMPSSSGGGSTASASSAAQPAQSGSTVILHGSTFSAESVADLLTNLIKDNGGQSLVNVIRGD